MHPMGYCTCWEYRHTDNCSHTLILDAAREYAAAAVKNALLRQAGIYTGDAKAGETYDTLYDAVYREIRHARNLGKDTADAI